MKKIYVAVVPIVLFAVTPGIAAIPLPDSILYGTVRINGVPQTASSDVTVIARVDRGGGQMQEVARYHMGDETQAGDLYVLRIRLESLEDGTSQGDHKALVGQTAQVLVQQGTGTPQLVTTYLLAAQGAIAQMDLPPMVSGDIDGDSDVDTADLMLFVRVLLEIDADPTRRQRSDLNASGAPDAEDIQPFVNAIVH